MKRKIFICLLINLLLGISLFSQAKSTATLEIKFTGIRSDKGVITAGLKSSPDGWPRKSDKEFKWDKQELKDGILVVEINGLSHGTYAISALDDENQNHELDLLRGERFGFSKNPQVRLSAPKFKDCSFPIQSDLTKIEIRFKNREKEK
jgi:uncharacterized protein (DUF2141 family)